MMSSEIFDADEVNFRDEQREFDKHYPEVDLPAPGSLSFSPTKERWLFMCTECGVPKLMPAIPQNQDGQSFHCAVCLERTFFVRLNLSPPTTFSLP
jgi:hypothetical protein